MGPGTGILALVDYLDLPEIYTSYGDTNVDRLTNPDLYKDALRVPANAFLDATTFLGDIGADIPAAVYDKAMATEFYNPFSEEGQARNLERSKGFLPYIPGIDFQMNPLSDKGMDAAAATISAFTGLPSLTVDNPMVDYSLAEEMYKDSMATIDSKYAAQEDQLADQAKNYTDNTMPSFATFAINNPNQTIQDYQKMQDDMFQEKYQELFRTNLASQKNEDLQNLLAQNSNAVFGYNLFGDDDSISSLFGPGIRKFNLGNIAGTDIPMKYASEGEYVLPFLEYEGPEKEKLEKLTLAAEIAGGLGSTLRALTKRGFKQGDRISPELQDAVNEYLRD